MIEPSLCDGENGKSAAARRSFLPLRTLHTSRRMIHTDVKRPPYIYRLTATCFLIANPTHHAETQDLKDVESSKGWQSISTHLTKSVEPKLSLFPLDKASNRKQKLSLHNFSLADCTCLFQRRRPNVTSPARRTTSTPVPQRHRGNDQTPKAILRC